MKQQFLVLFAVMAMAVGLSVTAHAGSVSASSTVTINYTGVCEISTSNFSLTYGGDDSSTTTGVAVNCSNGASWSLASDGGLNMMAGVRRATNGAGFLRYRIYKDAALTEEVDPVVSNVLATGTGTGVAQDYTAYLAVKKIEQFGATGTGNYTDTLGWTLTF